MQRIQSGVTDQYVYFMLVDATDLKTPETGIASFTVYRSRNGGTATVYTTPTVAELSAANMPGWYRLLVDEDTTIDAGDAAQNMALHITATGCAPARLVIELFRPPVSAGETLTVSSGNGNAAVQSIANNAITAAAIATDAIDADAIAAGAIDAGAIATGAITAAKFAAGAIDNAAIAADAIGSSELAASAVTEIQTGLATSAALATAQGDVTAIKAKTDNLPVDPADQSLVIAAADAIYNRIGAPVNGSISQDMQDNRTAADGLYGVLGDPVGASISADIAAIQASIDSAPSVSAIASAVHNFVVESTYTFQDVTRLSAAALLGEVSGAETAAPILFKGIDGVSARITMTGDQYGNRASPIFNVEDA